MFHNYVVKLYQKKLPLDYICQNKEQVTPEKVTLIFLVGYFVYLIISNEFVHLIDVYVSI